MGRPSVSIPAERSPSEGSSGGFWGSLWLDPSPRSWWFALATGAPLGSEKAQWGSPAVVSTTGLRFWGLKIPPPMTPAAAPSLWNNMFIIFEQNHQAN